jgi:hypothetical protein
MPGACLDPAFLDEMKKENDFCVREVIDVFKSVLSQRGVEFDRGDKAAPVIIVHGRA